MLRLRLPLLPALAALALFTGPALRATGGSQPAPARAPAPTLARPASPTKAPDADGFLRRWLLLEPIRVPGQLTESAVQAAVKKDYFLNQLTVVPRDGDTVSAGDQAATWHAVDTIAYNVNLFHFAYALNKPTSNVLFWAVTVVDAPRDLPGVRLAIGSNAASIWWLNGEEVIELYNDRQSVIELVGRIFTFMISTCSFGVTVVVASISALNSPHKKSKSTSDLLPVGEPSSDA